MSDAEISAFVLHATTRGAADAPEELVYRRDFESGECGEAPWVPGVASDEVEQLLAPFGAQRFAERHLGRSVAHISGVDSDRFAELFSFRRMAELLAARGLPPEQIDVFSAARERVPRAEYAHVHPARGGLWLDQDALFDRVLRQRGSMVLNALSDHDRTLSALACALHRWTGQRVKINAYLTPSGGKTFGWHWDGHDVFVVQVEGRKRWCLFEPVMAHPLADGSAAKFQELRQRRTPLREQLILERGDVLYLPGGVPHDVEALDEDSLHLTIGFSPLRWEEIARASFDAALRLELQRAATRASAVGLVREPVDASDRACYDALVDRLVKRMRGHDLGELFAAASSADAQDSIADLAQRWSWCLHGREVAADAVLRLCHPQARLCTEPEFLILEFGERVLVLDARAGAALRGLLARKVIRVSDLDGLRPAEQVRLAAALLEYGVAAIEPTKVEVRP